MVSKEAGQHKESSVLSLPERHKISKFYGLNTHGDWTPNTRGLVNKTYELDDRYFLTVYQQRTREELEAVAHIAAGMSEAVPITRPRKGQTGFSVDTSEGHALLSPRLPGIHYVGLLHTDKQAIPTELHGSLATFFWQLQEGLSDAPCNLMTVLKGPSRDLIGKMPEPIPDVAKPLAKYAPAEGLPPFNYLDLIHDDLERQNILSVGDNVTGVVDLDSIHAGDILYEYGHFLFNNVFCDPEYSHEIAALYIDKAKQSGRIDEKDIPSLYGHMYRFAISDVADFLDLVQHAKPGEQIIDLDLLVTQYDQALSFASDFFRSGLPTTVYTPAML